MKEMKKFTVIIDFESRVMEIEAETREEAETKAIEEYEKHIEKYPIETYWVGEVEEI